jgi:hypothetical protein
MRSTSLSRVGAERTRTHVVATAYSHGPTSDTGTLGGREGLGGTMAGSIGTVAGGVDGAARATGGAIILAAAGDATGAAAGTLGAIAGGALGAVVLGAGVLTVDGLVGCALATCALEPGAAGGRLSTVPANVLSTACVALSSAAGSVAARGTAVSGADADGPIRCEMKYPTATIAAMAMATRVRPRTRRAPAGAVDMRQFGQTPMATGRCTPQLGQFTVSTRSPPGSYDTKGT